MKFASIATEWKTCGIGVAEQTVQELCKKGEITKVKGRHIKSILTLKNKFATEETMVETNYQIEPEEDYFIYYNYHPNSGYETFIYKKGNGQFRYEVKRPKGGVLQAFFSEVIIFQ